MEDKISEFWKIVNQQKLDFFNKKICSVKQFVGEGEIHIDNETTYYNSSLVKVIVKRNNGDVFTLKCDKAISNGIKTGAINEDFLMHEELDITKPYYITYCCIFYENENFTIKFDISNYDCGPWDFLPIEYPDDNRFSNYRFKILCSVEDYIGMYGYFYQNKIDNREFVLTQSENDRNPIRLLCSQELEFQLLNGKNPKDLLKHFIGIYVNDNDEDFLRIFDISNFNTESWYRDTGVLFIIDQIMKNPFKYSFINIIFNDANYLKLN